MSRGQNKGSFRSSIKKDYATIDSYVLKKAVGHKDISHTAEKQLAQNNGQDTSYEVRCHTKTFGRILLRKLMNIPHTRYEVDNFFTALDSVDSLILSVDNPDVPYFGEHDIAICTVAANGEVYSLSAYLVWLCLLYPLKNGCQDKNRCYQYLEQIFTSRGKKIVLKKLPSY